MSSLSDTLKNLQQVKDILGIYHGAKQLKNIPEFTASHLYQELIRSGRVAISLDLTVRTVINNIANALSADSVILQFAKFQEKKNKSIITPSQRTPENQRLDFYASNHVYKRLQMIFSPQEHYFTMNGFKEDDKKHNRKVFQDAIDTVVIDPVCVSENSLETLDIVLDPDCQNIKDIFKKMRPLEYQNAEDKKYTFRIYEYQGKYIVFTAHKIIYDATQPVTKGEQRKEDVQCHMSVYPDIFSLIRREEYILDTVQEKQQKYQHIKEVLLASLKEIDRNKKDYSVLVQQNIREIIAEIDQASSAKIVADKLYHLYKIGNHSEHDKKLLSASMNNFTQRIAQLMGISSHTQLHLLQLNDVLDDQNHVLEYFYAQVAMFADEPNIPYERFLVAFENYYRSQNFPRKEPFLTFDIQIRQCFGDLAVLKTKNPHIVMMKAKVICALQKKYREIFTWEHAYKRGELSAEDLQKKISSTSGSPFVHSFPGLHNAFFAEIDKKRAMFSPDFTQQQLNDFFDDLTDLDALQKSIDAISTHITEY